MWDIFVGIFTGIILLMIERFLIPENEKNHEVTNNTERVFKSEKIIIKEKVVYVNQKKNDDNTDSYMWLIIILSIAAVAGYIKYSRIVHSTIIIISTAIGIMTLGMAFFCMKKGMKFKKELNLVLIINTLALVIVPYIINLTTKASEKQGIDIAKLKQEAELGNMFGSADLYDILFLMYQILGLVCVIIYLLCILISNLYLISLININLNSKWNRMWSFIYAKTYRLVSKPITIIVLEITFLIISYLLVSGVAWNLIEK
jgi:NADH:ubiquinone oxidoreductase subunit 6 (subunit J)